MMSEAVHDGAHGGVKGGDVRPAFPWNGGAFVTVTSFLLRVTSDRNAVIDDVTVSNVL